MHVTPERILQTGMGFMAAKTLMSATELDLFTTLGDGAMTGTELCAKLHLAPRANPDFFDALLSMGLLERDGDGEGARYRNTAETAAFLDRTKPSYVGGLLEMCNDRLYAHWDHLTDGLKTGIAQNKSHAGGDAAFDELYESQESLEQFMNAMAGVSLGNFTAFSEAFDFAPYKTLLDVGGASGQLSTMVAARHPHMHCTTFDIPKVTPIALKRIHAANLGLRVHTLSGDMFQTDWPKTDIVTMSHILHDWNMDGKRKLIDKAYAALNPGGAFVVIESLIDDARRRATPGLLMSLNMLVELGDAFDFTAADFFGWAEQAGFERGHVIPLTPAAGAAVVRKPG